MAKVLEDDKWSGIRRIAHTRQLLFTLDYPTGKITLFILLLQRYYFLNFILFECYCYSTVNIVICHVQTAE